MCCFWKTKPHKKTQKYTNNNSDDNDKICKYDFLLGLYNSNFEVYFRNLVLFAFKVQQSIMI